MNPSIGRIVIAIVDPNFNNGSDVCPAIITRVWGPNMVNIKTLNDSTNTEWKTSVTLYHDEVAARAPGAVSRCCFWPARV